MAEQTLTPETWRAKARQARVVSLATLGGAKIILRPISALRASQMNVENGTDQRRRIAAMVAETALAGEVEGDKVVSAGSPIWTLADFDREDFPADVLTELINVVADYYNGDPAKN